MIIFWIIAIVLHKHYVLYIKRQCCFDHLIGLTKCKAPVSPSKRSYQRSKWCHCSSIFCASRPSECLKLGEQHGHVKNKQQIQIWIWIWVFKDSKRESQSETLNAKTVRNPKKFAKKFANKFAFTWQRKASLLLFYATCEKRF